MLNSPTLGAIVRQSQTQTREKANNRLAKLRDEIVLELPQAIEQREAEQNWFESVFASIFSDGPITADDLAELQILSAAIYISPIKEFSPI